MTLRLVIPALLLSTTLASATPQNGGELVALTEAVADRLEQIDELIAREDERLDQLGERMDMTRDPEQRARLSALQERLTSSLDQLEAVRSRLAGQLETLHRQGKQLEQQDEGQQRTSDQ